MDALAVCADAVSNVFSGLALIKIKGGVIWIVSGMVVAHHGDWIGLNTTMCG